ncbi:MAG: SDR family oxidoreductase [Gemmataceae bacterium]|nr:SDR family oxidoreductase [Gemmataceae bacterium]MCI0741503.1 SDR family oxidoreductase [Gemmataceae bacterium]
MTIFDRFRLDGKRALITGGSRGLGRAMAQALAEAGADLILVSRSQESLDQARVELTATGRKITCLAADIELPENAEKTCERVLAEHGPVDILINNVGGRRENIALEAQSLAEWRRLFDLNLTNLVVCTRVLGKPMLERGWGRVINIASICGEIAGRNIHGRHYETAKAAVVGFTRALAADWAPRGVTVNAISPGPFLTDANRRWFRERPEFQKEVEGYIPMGRLGGPDEIGPLAVYLASAASAYMTGATLTIDGGYTLW